ncbi:MAG: hypothetical protein F4Y60_00565 [Boseongicola sp. SB0664_bin_43]|uniref:Uncharacterized protein n=1 Tax=Boseongicola sp. SB0664_bin_43 TaxID=2604844 RepID=A0A6B0XXQ9_9RHOB|nr:hypothetical protein [Boseongicola sp. SB0664_bin_43]
MPFSRTARSAWLPRARIAVAAALSGAGMSTAHDMPAGGDLVRHRTMKSGEVPGESGLHLRPIQAPRPKRPARGGHRIRAELA